MLLVRNVLKPNSDVYEAMANYDFMENRIHVDSHRESESIFMIYSVIFRIELSLLFSHGFSSWNMHRTASNYTTMLYWISKIITTISSFSICS